MDPGIAALAVGIINAAVLIILAVLSGRNRNTIRKLEQNTNSIQTRVEALTLAKGIDIGAKQATAAEVERRSPTT